MTIVCEESQWLIGSRVESKTKKVKLLADVSGLALFECQVLGVLPTCF